LGELIFGLHLITFYFQMIIFKSDGMDKTDAVFELLTPDISGAVFFIIYAQVSLKEYKGKYADKDN
jgi:hypothetical protein